MDDKQAGHCRQKWTERSWDQDRLPQFQRGLVWNEDQQKELIRSLKEGYPIGTLLLHGQSKQGNDFLLVDGLQRTYAIKTYCDHIREFLDITDIRNADTKGHFDKLAVEFSRKGIAISAETLLQNTQSWVKSKNGFDAVNEWESHRSIRFLANRIAPKEFSVDDVRNVLEEFDDTTKFFLMLLDGIRDNAKIDDFEIPILIFTGSETELPTVFERLNTGGTVLSKYDILAAQWDRIAVRINNASIREAIEEKYSSMLSAGMVFDFDVEERDATDDFNLYEYLYGFGQVITNDYPELFEPSQEQELSSIGFNLVAACLNQNVQRIGDLPSKLDRNRLSADPAYLDGIEKRIRNAADFVRDKVLNFLVKMQIPGSRKRPLHHTDYQIISMIATTYAYFEAFPEKTAEAARQLRTLRASMRLHYLADSLSDYWRGSGDTKLFNAVAGKRYFTLPESLQRMATWSIDLDRWSAEQAKRIGRTRSVSLTSPSVLFLRYAQARTISQGDSITDKDVEHIIPVEQLKSRIPDDSPGWPINHVANLALLHNKKNRSKKGKNFREWIELRPGLTPESRTQELERLAYELVCHPDIVIAKDALTEESFGTFLSNRFNALKSEFQTILEKILNDEF
ncbi:MAG: DUF262 domain-containing protein [Chloroflexi bacterium]|nr:DUF262 domain-containing protein [Chloroflexota bacterium]